MNIGDFIYPPYENYETKTFLEVYPTSNDFLTGIRASGLNPDMLDEDINIAYYLISSRYGNSHAANSDETQFKNRIYSVMFMYGPSWAKRLDIQKKVRALTDADIFAGGRVIYNHAFNPNTEPSTDALEQLSYINEQNATNYKKSKLEGYAMLSELVKTDVSNDFLEKFKRIFVIIGVPTPHWSPEDLQ